MTTHYEITVIRFDDYGTDAAERVTVLEVQTADASLAELNLRAAADRLAQQLAASAPDPVATQPVEPAATGAPKPRARRKDAGQPRGPRQRFGEVGSTGLGAYPAIESTEPLPEKAEPTGSPFAIIATATGSAT